MAKSKKKSPAPLRAPVRTSAPSSRRRTYQRPSFFWVLARWFLILGVWCSIFLAGVLAWFALDLPDVTQAANFARQTSITVKAADGKVIARYGETKGKNISVDDMPKHLIEAILATEDRRFYEHPGIDILGILRAITVNTVKGRFVQGGSTITQQLAKNLFLTHDRTMKRKIQEAMLALWLEHELTKDEILSAYANRVYMGSGIYGMDAAAELYFDKPLKAIDLREAATLAGLLKAPSKYSPSNNPALAKERADVVLAAMADAGYITQKQAKGMATSTPKPRDKPAGAKAAKYFSDWVIDGLDDIIGTPEMDLIVETTLDSGIQDKAEQSLTSVLAANGGEHKISQGSVIVMRPDGAVLTMVGGRDYSLSEFNRAVQAQRSPGSSFKPIVFVTALEQGWRPDSIILDAPIAEGRYKPQNFGNEYYGDVRLADALALSMNTATVRLMKEVGVNSVISNAKKMGIISKLEPDLSLALGSSGISMLEMTTAYATLANGGHRIFPYAINKITDAKGRVLYERKAPYSYQRVLNSRSAYNISTMMQGVLDRGTGQRAKLPFVASGKTGTSQDSRDAWFIGFTNEIVTAVWLGNDDNSPMKGVTGGVYPAEIWRNVMSYSHGRYNAFAYGAPDIAPAGGMNENSYAESNNENGGGISGLLGRLLSSDNSSQDNNSNQNSSSNKPVSDYSNLND